MTIRASTPKADWIDLLVVLLPAPVIVLLALVPEPLRERFMRWLAGDWGSIASVWGLGVSVYLLWVAKGARAAATRATEEATQAAEAAQSAARTRSALEDLQAALSASRQVSHHAAARNWQVVKLKAEEVMESCRVIVNRWEHTPALDEVKNSLNQAAAMMRSIAEEASKEAPSQQRIVKVQLGAHEHISSVEGRFLQEQDRRRA